MGKATAPRAKAAKPSIPSQVANAKLSSLSNAAFNEGSSVAAVIAALLAAFIATVLNAARDIAKMNADRKPGNKLATAPAFDVAYDRARTAFMAGYIASAIPSNATPDERVARGHTILASAAPDAKSLKENQAHRTVQEQNAYNSAKQAWSSRIKAANIPSPSKAGGAVRNVPKKPEPKVVKLETLQRKAAAALKFAPPAKADRETALDYLQRQAATMAAYIDKAQAKTNGALPPAIVSAVADFRDAIKNVT